MSKPLNNAAFGEVIASSIDSVTVECWTQKILQQTFVPNFADVVKFSTAQGIHHACVKSIKTVGRFGGSLAVAFGLPQEQLQIEQPQIFDLMVTQVEAKVFAATREASESAPIFGLTLQPVPIHTFAAVISDEEFVALSQMPMFFFYVLKSVQSNLDVDQLAFALVAKLAKIKKLNSKFFENFYEQYSLLPDRDTTKARLLFLSFEQLVV